MNKDEIIKNLSRKNEELKAQVEEWKEKYFMIEQAYQQLLNTAKPSKPKEEIKTIKPNNDFAEYFDFEDFLSEEKRPKQVQPVKQELPPISKTPEKKPQSQPQSEDIFDFFSESIPSQVDRNSCSLIQGCFIIQKISSIDHFDPLRFVHPPTIKLKSMFDIIYRFIFVNDQIPQIRDDEFDSRKNEIYFGAPCQDFQFVFDNIDEKSNKDRLNQFEKDTHLMRKRYIYGVVRPEVISIEKRSFQTEMAYGFISHVPFPGFFKDLNRIVQQELKFRMLNMNKSVVNKKEKVDIISEIIKDITVRSIERGLEVVSYPINLELVANVCGLRLVYSGKSNYVSDQFNYIQSFIHRFSRLKLVKILHYVLSEQHIIIVAKNRRHLNQLFQVIRSFIYPFNWIFPIIYYYSPFFEPFLSSPLPIIIGLIDGDYEIGDQSSQRKMEIVKGKLPQNDFITIYAEEEDREDLNEIASFDKRIRRCYKSITKQSKKTNNSPNSKSQSHLSALIGGSLDQRLTYKFFNYIKKLRLFIQTGKTQEEVDDFLIQLIDTQLVSYYKQNLAGSKDKK